MRKRRDSSKSFTERLDAVEEMLRELSRRNDAAEAAFYEKYGDKAEAILQQQRRIAELFAKGIRFWSYKGPELQFFHDKPFDEPLESLVQELYALRGAPRKRFWTPDWCCPCGHRFTLWVRFYSEGPYKIHCESCMVRCGEGSQEQMEEAVARNEARDIVDLKSLQNARFPVYMMKKQISEHLGISIDDVTGYIGTKGFTVADHVTRLRGLSRPTEQRKVQDETSDNDPFSFLRKKPR